MNVFVCVDVAHGHHILVKETLQQLRNDLGPDVHIMAGNVATAEGLRDLSDWGANSVRISLGSGSVCSTRRETGHGIPTFQAVYNCKRGIGEAGLRIFGTPPKAKIIADGGIKNAGDCVKSFAGGANAVMLGSLLAATDEAPGNVITSTNGKMSKLHEGMASPIAQQKWRGRVGSAEGISTTIPYKGPVKAVLEDLERGVRSGFSYSGAKDLRTLHTRARFVAQTSAGTIESGPHIL